MKLRLFSLTLLAAGLASAETFSGTVVDVMCKGKDLAGHTRSCALDCAKSGFGLVQADGKFLEPRRKRQCSHAFDAQEELEGEVDSKVKVTGTVDGDVIKVQAVELLP